MYNKSYDTSLRSLMDNGFLFSKTMGTSTSYNYYYSSSINYNSSTEKYELESDAEQISWATYKTTSLDGQKRYTCLTTSSLECKEVYYVLDVTTESNTLFARIISGGDLPSNPDGTITFSKDISSSPDIDGKYSLEGSTRIDLTRMEWYSNYNTYFYGIVYNDYPKKYYYCSDYSDKCAMENMRYLINPRKTISSPTMGVIYLKPVDIIKFGSSFKYENDEYTLDGTTYDIWNYDNSNERNKIANAHYTCFNASGMCQEISYVYYYQNTNGLNYINLSNGANIGQIINETLYYDNGDETVNKYDSTIKQGVDMWFKKYLRNYSEYLEETVFCNDRTINVFAGWDPNGGNIKPGTLYFRYNSAGFKPDVDLLDCTNITDQFSTSVNDTKAKLTYSVGLLTTAERRLLQNSTFTETPKQYWLMTPNNISIYISMNTLGASSYTSNGTNSLYGVRPVISLAPGIEYSEGNGSQATPYIIDVE